MSVEITWRNMPGDLIEYTIEADDGRVRVISRERMTPQALTREARRMGLTWSKRPATRSDALRFWAEA